MNPAKHILALPSREEQYDHDDTLVSRTDYRYDGLPLGEVDRGAQTHELHSLLEEGSQLLTQRFYLPTGQLERIVDPLLHEQRIGYDALGVQPAWSENDLGHRTEYEIDALTTKVRRETTSNGLVTERTYDGLGREVLRRQSHPLHGNALQPVERVTYDDASRPSP